VDIVTASLKSVSPGFERYIWDICNRCIPAIIPVITNGLLDTTELYVDRFVIAGGAIRRFFEHGTTSDWVGDVDFFIVSGQSNMHKLISRTHTLSLTQIESKMFQTKNRYMEVISIPNNDMPIQLIDSRVLKSGETMFMTSVDEVLDTFDFTCCQAGVEIELHFASGFLIVTAVKSVFLPQFLVAVARRELALAKENIFEKTSVSYRRLYKYVSTYGYKVYDQSIFTSLNERMKLGMIDYEN